MQSQPSSLKVAFQKTHETYIYCLKSTWISLVALTILTLGFSAIFNKSLSLNTGDELLVVSAKLGLLLFGVFPSVVYIFNVPYFLERRNNSQFKESLGEFTWRTLVPLLTESIRPLTSVLLGFLKLIFPGFKRMIEYMLVPFVVYFEPDYKSKDALKVSKKLCTGFLIPLAAITILEMVINEGLGYGAQKMFTDSSRYYIPLITTPFRIVISIYTYSIMYYLYKAQSQRLKENS